MCSTPIRYAWTIIARKLGLDEVKISWKSGDSNISTKIGGAWGRSVGSFVFCKNLQYNDYIRHAT